MFESVNPAIKQLLSDRVQTNIRVRGVDPTEMLREEPNRPRDEVTPEEKKKLEIKRLKNRLHAKQSRERKNMVYAKTEEENKVLKLERGILRYLSGKYYRELHDRDISWRDIEVDCIVTTVSSKTQSSQANIKSECVPYYVMLPDDICERLSSPCKFENIDRLSQELLSPHDKTGAINMTNRRVSTADVGIDIPSRGQTTTPNNSRSYDTITPSSYESMSDCDYLLEESSVGSQMSDSFFSRRQASTERVLVTDFADTVSPVVSVATNQAVKGFTIKEEMDEESHSPWMVTSGREKRPPKIYFNKKGDELKNNFSQVKNLQEKSNKNFTANQNLIKKQEGPKVSFSLELEKKTAVFASPVKDNIGPWPFSQNPNTNLKERKPQIVTHMPLCKPDDNMENGNGQTFLNNNNVHCQEHGTRETDRRAFQENAMEEATTFPGGFQVTCPVTESSMDESSIGLNEFNPEFPCNNGADDEGSEGFFSPSFLHLDALSRFQGQASGIRGQTNVENQSFGCTANANDIIFNEPPSTLSSLNLGGMEYAEVEALLPTFMLT